MLIVVVHWLMRWSSCRMKFISWKNWYFDRFRTKLMVHCWLLTIIITGLYNELTCYTFLLKAIFVSIIITEQVICFHAHCSARVGLFPQLCAFTVTSVATRLECWSDLFYWPDALPDAKASKSIIASYQEKKTFH